MSKSPSFQWYAADYLASQRVQMLTLEEEGAYIRMISYCWLHGSIPYDAVLCAKMVGKGASTTLIRVVQPLFKRCGSKMVHERLEVEREKQAKWREKSAAGGLASAKARRSSSKSKSHVGMKGGSTTLHRVASPKPNSSSSSSVPPFIPPEEGDGRAKKRAPAALADTDWLLSLSAQPAYEGIDVTREFSKAEQWCDIKRVKLSRRRFLAWLNRVERPMNAQTKPKVTPDDLLL